MTEKSPPKVLDDVFVITPILADSIRLWPRTLSKEEQVALMEGRLQISRFSEVGKRIMEGKVEDSDLLDQMEAHYPGTKQRIGDGAVLSTTDEGVVMFTKDSSVPAARPEPSKPLTWAESAKRLMRIGLRSVRRFLADVVMPRIRRWF